VLVKSRVRCASSWYMGSSSSLSDVMVLSPKSQTAGRKFQGRAPARHQGPSCQTMGAPRRPYQRFCPIFRDWLLSYSPIGSARSRAGRERPGLIAHCVGDVLLRLRPMRLDVELEHRVAEPAGHWLTVLPAAVTSPRCRPMGTMTAAMPSDRPEQRMRKTRHGHGSVEFGSRRHGMAGVERVGVALIELKISGTPLPPSRLSSRSARDLGQRLRRAERARGEHRCDKQLNQDNCFIGPPSRFM